MTRVEPSLRRALAGHLAPHDVPDALGEAFAFAWEHWDSLATMQNPVAYLFRVAQSRSRRRRVGYLRAPAAIELPQIEPRLMSSMQSLPAKQRSAVWLVHGCGWSNVEVADALGITSSTVATHLARGMARLRADLGINTKSDDQDRA